MNFAFFPISIQIVLILPMSSFVNGTFFSFTSLLSPRSPILSPRYRSRSSRSPANNFIQSQSPIWGLRFSVPAGLMSLFRITPSNQPNQSQQPDISLNGALSQLVRSLLASQNYGNYPNQNYRPPEQYLSPNIIMKLTPEFSIPPNVQNGTHLHNAPIKHGSHIHNIPTYHNVPHIHDTYGLSNAGAAQRFPIPNNVNLGQHFPGPPQRIAEFLEPPPRIPEQHHFHNHQSSHYYSINPNHPQLLPPGV